MTAAVNELPAKPEPYDSILRWKVPSREVPGAVHLTELDSFSFNGECDCDDFQNRFAKLLRRGITPEAAVRDRLVKLRSWQFPEDALRCFHLVCAWREFSLRCARAHADAKKIHRA